MSTTHTDYYGQGDHIVTQVAAQELLLRHKVEIATEDDRDAIEIGCDLGFLTLQEYTKANDYAHGFAELYMLRQQGIVVHQPNPLYEYIVFHVVNTGLY